MSFSAIAVAATARYPKNNAFTMARSLPFQKTAMTTLNMMKNNDMEIFDRQARICKAFAHPARLQILDRLGQGELGVADLQEVLGISKTNMSQHVAVLKSVGVLSTRREGKQVYCSLAIPEVKQACQLIAKVLRVQIAASHRLIE